MDRPEREYSNPLVLDANKICFSLDCDDNTPLHEWNPNTISSLQKKVIQYTVLPEFAFLFVTGGELLKMKPSGSDGKSIMNLFCQLYRIREEDKPFFKTFETVEGANGASGFKASVFFLRRCAYAIGSDKKTAEKAAAEVWWDSWTWNIPGQVAVLDVYDDPAEEDKQDIEYWVNNQPFKAAKLRCGGRRPMWLKVVVEKGSLTAMIRLRHELGQEYAQALNFMVDLFAEGFEYVGAWPYVIGKEEHQATYCTSVLNCSNKLAVVNFSLDISPKWDAIPFAATGLSFHVQASPKFAKFPVNSHNMIPAAASQEVMFANLKKQIAEKTAAAVTLAEELAEVKAENRSFRETLEFVKQCIQSILPRLENNNYTSYLSAALNRIMHALNGNIVPNNKNSKPSKSTIQKTVRKEAKKEAKKVLTKKTFKGYGKRAKKMKEPRPKGPATAAKIPTFRSRPPVKYSEVPGFKKAMNEFEKIQMAITCPEVSAPIRYSSELGGEPTAIARPWAEHKVDWVAAAGSPGNQMMKSTDTFIAQFRDPLRYIVQYFANPTNQAWLYQMWIGGNGSDASPVAPKLAGVLANVGPGEKRHVQMVYGTPLSTGANPPHGQLWCAGIANSGNPVDAKRFFWVGDHDTITISWMSTDSTEWGLDLWTVGGIRESYIKKTPAGTSGTLTFSSADMILTGYTALWVMNTGTADADIDIGVNIGGASSCYGHQCLPEFEQEIQIASNIRILASSVRYHNDSATLYNEGKIAICQAPTGKAWTQYSGIGQTDGYSIVSSKAGRESEDLKSGIYGWLKAKDTSDFDFTRYYTASEGILYDCFYPLASQKDFLVVYASCAIPTGQDGRWIFASIVEYETENVWRQITTSKTDPDLFSKAVSSLRFSPQFHDNPTHLMDLWNSIKSTAQSVLGGIAKYGPLAGEIASTAASFL